MSKTRCHYTYPQAGGCDLQGQLLQVVLTHYHERACYGLFGRRGTSVQYRTHLFCTIPADSFVWSDDGNENTYYPPFQRHAWGFHQLRSFIEYKAKLSGVLVVLVDLRSTSRTCPSCGCVDANNRRTRDDFQCVRCGFAGPDDHVAAVNIAAKGHVNGPIVTGDFSSHLGPPQLQAHEFICG